MKHRNDLTVDLLEASQDVLHWLRAFVGEDAWREITGQDHDTQPVESIKRLVEAINRARPQPTFEARVRELELEGLSHSDAQAVADAEAMKRGKL